MVSPKGSRPGFSISSRSSNKATRMGAPRCDHFLSRSRKIRAHLCGVEYPTPVVASEPARLNPCIGKVHLAARAVKLLVQRLRGALTQRGDDETRVLLAWNVLGLGDDATPSAPALVGAIAELGKDPRGPAGGLILLLQSDVRAIMEPNGKTEDIESLDLRFSPLGSTWRPSAAMLPAGCSTRFGSGFSRSQPKCRSAPAASVCATVQPTHGNRCSPTLGPQCAAENNSAKT